MISELAFCQNYSSFWRAVAPTTDLFIRQLNAGLYTREFPPLAAKTLPERRGHINEVAFALFRAEARGANRGPYYSPRLDEILSAAASVEVLQHARRGGPEKNTTDFDADEINDIETQFRRLMIIFGVGPRAERLIVSPRFSGCGIVDGCFGDLLFSTTLYEIKAGDRNFRSIDIRQLLTYTTLDYLSGDRRIDTVGLFNPRVGIRAEIALDQLCWEISGKGAFTLLTEIGQAISSGEISR